MSSPRCWSTTWPRPDNRRPTWNLRLQQVWSGFRQLTSRPCRCPTPPGLQVSSGRIVVDAVSSGRVTTLESELVGLGATVIGQFSQMVGAWLPISSLAQVAALPDLKLAEPSYKPVLSGLGSVGVVDDQAVQALRSDEARARYSVDGTGITIGILSDSFNSQGGYAGDIATGDLPSGIKVLQDLPAGEGTDEGRAMAQLVYKVAPGAKIAFTTAFSDITAFANGIINLAKPVAQGGAGAKIIVDDVAYENEPYFQDGLISQAVEQVIQQYGVTYFSAAGNSGRLAYENAFQPVVMSSQPAPGLGTGTFHNFASGGTTDIFQPVELLEGAPLDLDLQWDQPFASQSLGAAGKAGAQNDLAIYVLDSSKNIIASSTVNTVGGDPFQNIMVEIPGDINGLVYDSDYIVVKLVSGAAPKDMKYVFLGAGGGTALIDNYDTLSPTVFGHAEAADAAGVGAVEYDESPSYFLNPPAPEFYSSAGGTPIYFDANGNRLGSPVTRQQPRFSSIDGSDNTFLGADLDFNSIPNFSGTSAAAPHAAALAALMLQANPSLTSAQIFTILQGTSLPLDSGDGTPNVGYSFDGGWGLIQGDRALAAVEPRTVSGIVYKDTGNVGHYVAGDPVAAGATVYMDIAGNGHFDSGSTSVGTTTPLTIPFQPDPTQGPTRVSSPLSVSGIPGLITHLSVTLDISAVEDFNLGVTLVSPTGIRIPLIEQTGPGISDFPNVTIDDTGLDSVEDPGIIDFTNGTFEPDVELSALIGENPNGTWHLEGRDFGIAPGADSTLNSWSLNINYADPVATTDSQGKFTFAGPYVDANGSPIVGLAPAAYTGPINVGVQGFPGYNVQINASTSASFLKQDATTKGSWIGTYGAQGYDIVSGPSSLPSNDTVTPSGQSTYTWTTTSSDPRALQVPGSSNRVAAVWYSATSFTVDVNLADGQAHDLELYFLDWDNKGRSEQVQISDAGTGTVLDTETISSFSERRLPGLEGLGQPADHDHQGRPGPMPSSMGCSSTDGTADHATASFLEQDATTQGSWIGTYGAQGYDIVSGPSSLPSSDTVTPSGQSTYTWTTTSSDPRALQVPGSSNRVAAVWYSATSFTVDVNLADGQAHDLELYFLDWDNKGRSEQVQISDAGTGDVLDTETISSFTSGVYLDWKVSGNLVITITRQAGANAVLNGLFLDPTAPPPARPRVSSSRTRRRRGAGSAPTARRATTSSPVRPAYLPTTPSRPADSRPIPGRRPPQTRAPCRSPARPTGSPPSGTPPPVHRRREPGRRPGARPGAVLPRLGQQGSQRAGPDQRRRHGHRAGHRDDLVVH